MASRVTIYGDPSDRETQRLQREMNVMYVEYELVDPAHNESAVKSLKQWGEDMGRLPLVEIQQDYSDGRVFLANPDEPTLRQSLYSEGILSITAYWV